MTAEGPIRLLAPAKLNLCLYLGGRRHDGLHELRSLFEPLSLADEIEIEETAQDEVLCPGVEGENLAERALAELRSRGWESPPLRVRINKRIPVAAGLGGGSADAAAILRLAEGRLAGLERSAAKLGADVPSQLSPGMALVAGAGEAVEPLPDPEGHAVLLLPGGGGLPTAEVFAEADRLGLGRAEDELADLARRLREAAADGASPLAYAELLQNDLETAAESLRPGIADRAERLRGAGAGLALMTGSGPTVFGLFADEAAARTAAEQLGEPEAIVCAAGLPAGFAASGIGSGR
jgi:4-diphosphocytidyl-2-C-methyl-D-erythritol kinase